MNITSGQICLENNINTYKDIYIVVKSITEPLLQQA